VLGHRVHVNRVLKQLRLEDCRVCEARTVVLDDHRLSKLARFDASYLAPTYRHFPRPSMKSVVNCRGATPAQ
jgi:hypothetical protein